MTPITSEDQILSVINRHFPAGHPRLLLGRGDDCCVLAVDGALAVSTDLFLEDAHFRRSYFSPRDIGWKALAVNISDLAAAGAKPVGFSLGLALPRDADLDLVDGIFAGMAEIARPLDLSLTGGDLSRVEKLHLCVTVFGDSAREEMLVRGNARPGDSVFLIGQVGLARVGLEVLERMGRAGMERFPAACMAHLRPVPRVREGLALAKMQKTRRARMGLMDVSDGLIRDLPRLLGNLGADLTFPAQHPECLAWAETRNSGLSAGKLCCLGGEDYALAGTCEPSLLGDILSSIPDCAVLGQVTGEGEPVLWDGHPAASCGFDHFA